MTKRPDLASAEAALRRDVDEITRSGTSGVQELAEQFGVSVGSVYRWMDPDARESLSLARAGEIARQHGVTAMAEWLALCAGCRLVPIRSTDATIADALAAAGRVVTDLSDGHVSDDDLEHMAKLEVALTSLRRSAIDRRRSDLRTVGEES